MEFLKKLKDFKAGDPLLAEDMNAMVTAIRSLARGEHISTRGLLKTVSGGRVTLRLPKQKHTSTGGTYECKGFIVSCDAGTGALTMTKSAVSYGGSRNGSFTGPTYATGTMPASGTRYVWVKIEYSAVDTGNYGTAWQLDDVIFQSGTSMTADSKPVWDDSTETWTTSSGSHYSAWATIVDRVVENSFGGGLVLVICSIDDVRVVHGCAI